MYVAIASLAPATTVTSQLRGFGDPDKTRVLLQSLPTALAGTSVVHKASYLLTWLAFGSSLGWAICILVRQLHGQYAYPQEVT